MPRANFPTCYVCDPSSEHHLSPGAPAAPSSAQAALQNSRSTAAGIVSKIVRRDVTLSFFLRCGHAMQQSVTCSIRLCSSFAFCVVGGLASVVNMLHSGIAVRPCCTIFLSHGRPGLINHRGTILASTGCALGLRSCWKSIKRSLQRFVPQAHPVSG